MYFRPSQETVDFNEGVISSSRAGEVNVNSRPWYIRFRPGIEFHWRKLGCQGTSLLWFNRVFYIFVPVRPMDLVTHQTFHSSNLWVASVEIFQDTLLSVDGIMTPSLYSKTSLHIEKTTAVRWSLKNHFY